ncbi:phytoene desaturase family protein [Litoribacter populi]|uniref:phytoene desaturase family protein n=1 Tax=Litoribacter populi TaxID=2598460 RepID=UPI0011801F1D|nr:NAD(P)/FAD-dependent oxidoreductase [Litoribacter populi]
MSKHLDAIVVGSGPNGLAAAIYLQQKGLSTAIYEQADEVGGATRSGELTLPGFIHDLGSAIHPLGMASPFFKTLPLDEYGLEWVYPDIPFAHPFADGTSVAAYQDIDQTARQLGRDQEVYFDMMSWLTENWADLEEDILSPLNIPNHPIKMARFGMSALLPVTTFSKLFFKEEKTRAFFYGAAAHSTLPLTKLASASFGLVLHGVAHKYGWPFPRGGAKNIAESLAAYYRSLGGIIFRDSLIEYIEELPRAQAYLFDLTPKQLLKIKGTNMGEDYRKRLENYKYGKGVFKIDWALSEPIPFLSEECRKAGTIHFGYSTKEMENSARRGAKGYVSPDPYVLLAQHTIFDSSRAPKGQHTAWAYCHVPNGDETDMTPFIEAQIEKAAPGFKDIILARNAQTTSQMEAWNPNLVGGDINGGLQDISQLFTRPVASFSPYNTPNKQVYICSSSTPPGGGVHGMCGYNAAVKAYSDHFK